MKTQIIIFICLFLLNLNIFAQSTGDADSQAYSDAYNFGYNLIMEPFMKALREAEQNQNPSDPDDKKSYEKVFNVKFAIAAYGYFDTFQEDDASIREEDIDGDGFVYETQNGITDTVFMILNVKTLQGIICVLSNDADKGKNNKSEIIVYNLNNKNQRQLFLNAYNTARATIEGKTSNSANSTNTQSDFPATHIVTENVNVRTKASLNSDVLAVLQAGTPVKLLAKGAFSNIEGIMAQWYYVQTANGLEGWCFSAYLQAR